MDRLSPTQIAVVVQGPVFGLQEAPIAKRFTQQGLASVRRHLPGAEIVLSTWEGSATRGLEFDRLVLSADPGPAQFREQKDEAPRPTNVNRMIVSTVAGLKATKRPYVLKARSDLWLSSARFLDYFGRYPARVPTARVFAERILVHEQYTRSPDRCGDLHLLFHPGDCFQFGSRADLLTLWDEPLWPAEGPPLELVNEQYVWVRCLRKFIELPFDAWNQNTPALRKLAALALGNNFVVLGRQEFRIAARKLPVDLLNWIRTYSHAEWQNLYESQICGKTGALLEPVTLLKGLATPLQRWPRLFSYLTKFTDRPAA